MATTCLESYIPSKRLTKLFRIMKTRVLAMGFMATLLILSACTTSQKTLFINAEHPEIAYEGRISTTDDGAKELYWSGTSITLNFEGTGVSAIMKEARGDNYYNILVDGELHDMIRPGTEKATYDLVSGLENGLHSVTIFKRTEYDRGEAWFYGFELAEGGKVLPKEPEKKYKIEYYGDSITAGYSTNDYETDRSDSIYTNFYESYGHLVADYFDAEQHCTCKSGIGITISWFEYEMPDVWNLTNPMDAASTWDFEAYQPDLVVVNLFQNDSWLVNMSDHESFKRNFVDTPPTKEELIAAYAKFVEGIREAYPDAAIICTLGNMDITREGSVWPGYVEEAVASLGDDNIYTVFTPFKDTPGHPKAEEQKLIARNLISFIENTLGW